MEDWIKCDNQMPEEHDSMFAKYYGTEKWSPCMFKKTSDFVLATAEFPDGKRYVLSAHTIDGVWKHNSISEIKIVAWKPYPLPMVG